jgi:branched-chain amino acid aminotransferase
MEKQNLDWGNLTFSYMKTDYSYVSNYKDGAWDEGGLTPDHTVTLSECAGLLHYCQEVFEGLKAYTTKNGDIVCFRPDQNAQRMYNSAQRLCMPPFPKDRFVKAVEEVVKANAAGCRPFGSGATLYIRPFMFATGDVIGVKPGRRVPVPHPRHARWARTTRAACKPVKLQVSKYDRAAPHGTGNIKAGLNYAMSLYPSVEAHSKGYADNMFLDPRPAPTSRSPAAPTSCS